MKNKINISAEIITLNEEEQLESCLKSIKNLVDEIILVDSGSTDKTVSIAKKYGAKVFYRKFNNFSNQRNFTDSKASGEWIFCIAPDERATKELREEIKKVVENPNPDIDGYLISRRNFLLGTEIKYSRWSPDEHIMLWKKSKGKWVGDVHEEVVVDGKVGRLKNAKIHFAYDNLTDFLNSNNLYSKIRAGDLYKQGVRFSLFRLFWDPFYDFSLRYFYKKGFLDGWRGFVLAISMAIYQTMVWIKILELQKGKQK